MANMPEELLRGKKKEEEEEREALLKDIERLKTAAELESAMVLELRFGDWLTCCANTSCCPGAKLDCCWTGGDVDVVAAVISPA